MQIGQAGFLIIWKQQSLHPWPIDFRDRRSVEVEKFKGVVNSP